MTNKVLKLTDKEILSSHISSKKRDYNYFYSWLHQSIGEINSIIDLGCGVNGFSYPFILNEFGEINYLGVEATGQIVSNTNLFFKKNNFSSAKLIWEDLFSLSNIQEIINKSYGKKVIFLLQVVDALESIERNFSKKLLLEIKGLLSKSDFIVLSNSTRSISGKSKFSSNRDWLEFFLRQNFQIVNVTEMFNEKYFLISP
jgi:hypothetical protein